MKVNITFKPSCRFQFETTLICVAREKISQKVVGQHAPTSVEKASICIKCKGDYPLIRFTDIRND